MDAIIKAIGKTPSLATLPLRVEEGYLPALLTQSGGAMRALGAAMLRRETDRPIFVLCTDETNAGTLAADLEALLGESVVQLTGRDLALRDIEVVSRQEEQRRLRALDALYAGAGVAVCTVSGLLQRTLPPDILENAAFTLRLGEGEGPEALEPRLLACGYRRSDMVEGPGQFSRRGGILDIFSPGAERPVRAEFWGDEIDSMGFFDTDTQRRAKNIESFRVLPASESLVDPSRAGSIAKELLSRAARAERREQTELARRLRRDAELISTGAPLPWSDRYLPELYSEYSTALDFIAPDAIVYIDAPNRCAEKAKDISDSPPGRCSIRTSASFRATAAARKRRLPTCSGILKTISALWCSPRTREERTYSPRCSSETAYRRCAASRTALCRRRDGPPLRWARSPRVLKHRRRTLPC